MQLPRHRYIVGCEPMWSRSPEGGLIADQLLITTNIALDPHSSSYDQAKVAELDTAVFDWAREHAHRYRSYCFVAMH